MVPAVMDQQIKDIITVVEAHHMLVCKLCQQAVRPGDSVQQHFRTHKIKGQLLSDIAAYYGGQDFNDPIYGAQPADGSLPVAELPIFRGFCCMQCRFLTRDSDNMTRHWRQAGHEGGSERYREVRVQSWYWKLPRFVRYWVVAEAVRAESQTYVKESQLTQKLTQVKEEMAAEKAARVRKGDALEGLDRDTEWVKRAGWVRHFGMRDLVEIAEAAAWVDRQAGGSRQGRAQTEEEVKREGLIRQLGASFDRVVDKCCWRLGSVPRTTLQRLGGITASALPGVPQNGVPFREKDSRSMQKYRSTGHRYLGFCLRAHELGQEAAHERLGITFSAEQWGLVADVMLEVESWCEQQQRPALRVRVNTDESSGESSGESSDEDEDDEDSYAAAAAGPDTGPLDEAVFRLLVSSVRQEVGGHVYESPLMCFLAAAGVRMRPLGFAEPHIYTGILAAVLWWMRVVFLESCFEGQAREVEGVDLAVLKAFDEAHAEWMCAGTHTVAGEIIGLMAYGKGWRRNAAGQASVRWEEGKKALFHCGDRVDVEAFRRTARGLVDKAEELLDQLLWGVWEKVRETVDLGQIRDDMARRGVGESFATRPENEWLGCGPDKVIGLAGSALWDGRQGVIRTRAAERWARRLRRFREVLMTAVHVWGGQPGRGPELVTLRHADSVSLLRNVFVLEGMVALVTDRDKMKSIRGQGRKVARFVPSRLGRAIVAYVAWLLPAEEALARLCGTGRPRADTAEFMWRHGGSRVWESGRASALLGQAMQAGVGVRLVLLRYRAVAIELGRQFQGLAVRQAEVAMGEEEEDEAELDPATGEAVASEGGWDIVWDLQATHGTRIARQHYAVHVNFPGQLTAQMTETYREVSRLWHQFLEHEAKPATLRAARASWEAGQLKRVRARAGDGDLEGAMRAGLERLLGAGAEWRSAEQAEAAWTILGPQGREEPVIVVLPTGAGKSILFMLPAVMRGTGTSVVVVPFVALADDLTERARLAGVDCIHFRSSSSRPGQETVPRVARLVVVGAETATGPEFGVYADGLASSGQLGRIFLDECHTVITDRGYRAKLGELRGLHRFGRPVVMLTATLPVALEGWFRQAMLATAAIIVRGRTTKANCRYRVVRVKAGQEAKRAAEVMEQLGARMTGVEKGVVYCRSRGRCEAMAQATGCTAHHSGMTEEARREAREGWARGVGGRWIAATSGLGTGVDIEGIVAVVHMEAPYGLVDFVQQTGRGGRRAGEVVESVVVVGGQGKGPGQGRPVRDGFVEEVNTGRMEEFMQTEGCRREVLSSFMDGVAGETCGEVEGGAEACDRCSAAAGAVERDGDRGQQGWWTEVEAEAGRKEELGRQWLEEAGCGVCRVVRQYGDRPGAGGRVRAHEEGSGEQCTPVGWGEVRRWLRVEELTCCYRCRLPLDWCRERLEGTGADRCREEDRVMPVALLAVRVPWVRELVLERFGVDGEEVKRYIRWLGGEHRVGRTRGTNAVAVWVEVVWRAYRRREGELV